MKKRIIKNNKLSIIVLSLGVFMMSCSDTNSENTDVNTDKSEIVNSGEEVSAIETIAKDVEAEEFKSLIGSGEGMLIDVRTPEEIANGSIEGAVNMDYNGADFENEISKLDKEVPVYVYCASGGRSGNTMAMLKDMGFSEVYNLVGGYSNWPFK